MNINTAVLVAMMVACAGCLQSSQTESQEPSARGGGPAPPSAHAEVPRSGVAVEQAASLLHFNGCENVGLGYRWYGERNPLMPPDGWSASTNLFWTSTFYDAWKCERVAWGDLERPASFLFEKHDNFDDAFACTDAAGGNPRVIHRVYVDDHELVEVLGAALHWPTAYAELDLQAAWSDGVADIKAEWRIPGYEPSTLQSWDLGEQRNSPAYDARQVWQTPDGVSALEFIRQVSYYAWQSGYALADLSPPHSVAERTPDTGFARASYGFNFNAAMPITHYGDTKCEQPL